MSRNYVSKMLVGTGIANTTLAAVALEDLTDGQIIAFDFDVANEADNSITADTTNIGFARGTATLGEPILAGPIPVAGIRTVNNNPYAAPVNQISTLQVTAVPAVDETAIFKVAYHDNLSIIPNQIKQSVIGLVATAANTATPTAWAAAIAAEFNLQTGDNLFVTVTSATDTVTFTGITITTASNYNGINRPETLVFEIARPETMGSTGTYVIVDPTTEAQAGQGDVAKIAWLEEQHMGRLGYSDRRTWSARKYQSQIVSGITDYEVLVIRADIELEGDMQGLRANPIGALIATSAAGQALLETDLATAGIVPVVVAAHT